MVMCYITVITYLKSIAEILCLSSLGVTLSEEMKNAILGCYPYSEK
jgi:hypothetical protein